MYLTILRIYKYSLILHVMVRQTHLSVTCSNLQKRYYCLIVAKKKKSNYACLICSKNVTF
ncbi:hypothetical protein WUBG_17072 [Wuchereria bancrofti]|uniref:Uncharacterized protein n=1 Tax=Wuchereria bancrofti TaxID=6293 RepID=J9DR29_WUCBA|nr:hypothetical protein WUBG_17072 [Wuchereria bancrofti]